MRCFSVALVIVHAALTQTTTGCRPEKPRRPPPPNGEKGAPPTPESPPATRPTPPPSPTAGIVKTWETLGYGETEDDARDNALHRATKEVRDYLKEHYSDLDRPLTPNDLTVSGMAKVVDDKVLPRENNRPAFEAKVLVEIRQGQLSELYDQARKERVAPRHHMALLVLFGLCSLLVVGGIYLRLEQATRGYSTGLLRLVAATVLTVVVTSMIILW